MKTVVERFWAKVTVRSPDECWEWTGARGGKYLEHAIFSGPDTRCAYRQLYIWQNGPIDRKLDILHSCDHGWCVNPWHLRAGTRKENMADCVNRGRIARGAKHARFRLTPDMLRRIAETPGSDAAAGRALGVSGKTVAKGRKLLRDAGGSL